MCYYLLFVTGYSTQDKELESQPRAHWVIETNTAPDPFHGHHFPPIVHNNNNCMLLSLHILSVNLQKTYNFMHFYLLFIICIDYIY